LPNRTLSLRLLPSQPGWGRRQDVRSGEPISSPVRSLSRRSERAYSRRRHDFAFGDSFTQIFECVKDTKIFKIKGATLSGFAGEKTTYSRLFQILSRTKARNLHINLGSVDLMLSAPYNYLENGRMPDSAQLLSNLEKTFGIVKRLAPNSHIVYHMPSPILATRQDYPSLYARYQRGLDAKHFRCSEV